MGLGFNQLEMERVHAVKGLDPIADFMDVTAGGVTIPVNMQDYDKCCFYMYWGVGTTGTATVQVEACDNITPSNHTAIPFYYRATSSTDVPGTITLAAAAGIATTAGSSQIFEVEVNAADVAVAASNANRKYVRLLLTEVVDSPVLGGVLILLVNPKFRGAAVPRTVVT